MHALGVAHRDIKPENILCQEDLHDVKIADFGLSKIVVPKEEMVMPCGTLSYVAPEVLTLQGYGKEADLWSVGVVMYLLIRGRLPFDGKSKVEIIERTIHSNLLGRARNGDACSIGDDPVWSKCTPPCQDLVKGLLRKDPQARLTAAAVLEHAWMHPVPTETVHVHRKESKTGMAEAPTDVRTTSFVLPKEAGDKTS